MTFEPAPIVVIPGLDPGIQGGAASTIQDALNRRVAALLATTFEPAPIVVIPGLDPGIHVAVR